MHCGIVRSDFSILYYTIQYWKKDWFLIYAHQTPGPRKVQLWSPSYKPRPEEGSICSLFSRYSMWRNAREIDICDLIEVEVWHHHFYNITVLLSGHRTWCLIYTMQTRRDTPLLCLLKIIYYYKNTRAQVCIDVKRSKGSYPFQWKQIKNVKWLT